MTKNQVDADYESYLDFDWPEDLKPLSFDEWLRTQTPVYRVVHGKSCVRRL